MKVAVQILAALVLFFNFNQSAIAQWTGVSSGLGNMDVTSLSLIEGKLYAGTNGGGIYVSTNNGDSWTAWALNSSLPSQQINAVTPGTTSTGLMSYTRNGWMIYDGTNAPGVYNTSSLASQDIRAWTGGGTGRLLLATYGAGMQYTTNSGTNWNSGTGIPAGNAQFVNAVFADESHSPIATICATNAGIYFSNDRGDTWAEGDSGLTGDALYCNAFIPLSQHALLLTGDGLYFASEIKSPTWTPWVASGDFRCVATTPGTIAPIYIFGNGIGKKTSDIFNYDPVDLTGITGGAIISTTITAAYIFVGTESGGVFRMPLPTVDVREIEGIMPQTFSLSQNYPNPFNPTTTIVFSLPHAGHITLEVFNTLGQEVASLLSHELPAGTYETKWDATSVPSGVYFYRLQAGSFTETKKLILLR